MNTPTNMVPVIRRVFLNGWEFSATCTQGDQSGRELEVNIISTEPQETLAALTVGRALAKDLRARIRLLAPQTVPLGFPLEWRPSSIDLAEKRLIDLVSQGVQGLVETTVHFYLCRNVLDTLGQVLQPHSLVVIGGKCWWPNDASCIAGMLRKIGHQVIFVRNSAASAATALTVESSLGFRANEVAKHA
jgi:hypothetical protein